MTTNLFFALLVVLTVILMAQPASAFECPKRFKAAQAAIDKATKGMKGMMKMMSKKDMALVHALIDDAKTALTSAKHNHAKPQGMFDHARAIAKANAAHGYAEAADIYHFKLMAKMKKMMKK